MSEKKAERDILHVIQVKNLSFINSYLSLSPMKQMSHCAVFEDLFVVDKFDRNVKISQPV